MSDTESVSSEFSNTTGTTSKTEKLMNLFELECDLEQMADTLESLVNNLDSVDSQIKVCEKPIVDITLDKFKDPSFLAASPFRKETFALKPPGLPNIDLNKRYPYSQIVSILRNYLFNEKLVAQDGTIRVNKPLSQLFEIQETETTFLKLLARLRNVLL